MCHFTVTIFLINFESPLNYQHNHVKRFTSSFSCLTKNPPATSMKGLDQNDGEFFTRPLKENRKKISSEVERLEDLFGLF